MPHLTQLLENDSPEHFQLFLVPSEAGISCSLKRPELGRALSASPKQLLRQLTACSLGTRAENKKSYVHSFPGGEIKSKQSRLPPQAAEAEGEKRIKD